MAAGVVTPVVTMRALAPSMAVVAGLLSVSAEPLSSLLTIEEYFDDPEEAMKSCGHIIIGALLGTAMVFLPPSLAISSLAPINAHDSWPLWGKSAIYKKEKKGPISNVQLFLINVLYLESLVWC